MDLQSHLDICVMCPNHGRGYGGELVVTAVFGSRMEFGGVGLRHIKTFLRFVLSFYHHIRLIMKTKNIHTTERNYYLIIFTFDYQ